MWRQSNTQTGLRYRQGWLPPLARLGGDMGWRRIQPTLCGIGWPILLIDPLILGMAGADAGGEILGDRDPRLPLPQLTGIVAEVPTPYGIRLIDDAQRLVLAERAFRTPHETAWIQAWRDRQGVLVAIGDTYRVGLSWAALFDCHVGVARPASVPQHRTKRRSATTPAAA